MVVIGIVGVPSLVCIVYAERLGVRGTEGMRMARSRMVPVLVLVVVLAAGLLVRGSDDGVSASTLWVPWRAPCSSSDWRAGRRSGRAVATPPSMTPRPDGSRSGPSVVGRRRSGHDRHDGPGPQG